MAGPYTTIHNLVRIAADTVRAAQGYTFAYENQYFSPEDIDDPWVGFEIASVAGTPVAFGAGQRIRHRGSWRAEINVPPLTGDKGAREIADKLYEKFANKNITGVKYYTPQFTSQGLVRGWWQCLLVCPFRYDEIVPQA